MNPFKHKQLEEFTISDCELYINKYPYGEHLLDVKRHLKTLTKVQQNKPSDNNILKENKEESELQSENKISTEHVVHSSTKSNTSNDVVRTIFSWICIIVVVLIVGSIIITILNEILPYNWWKKFRYIIFPAGLALGRWLQKELDW